MGLVVFGSDAAVETLVHAGNEPVSDITAHVERTGTDIGRAIEVAISAFPPGEHRRIVLMSDGRENLGDARAAATVARSLGAEIHTIALEKAHPGKEVRVHGLAVPSRVRVHEAFKVQAVVHSSAPARAHLVIQRNGAVRYESQVELQPGANVYSFVEQAEATGLQEYEAIVNSEGDGEPENNRYQAFVQVQGPPRVLHAMGAPAAGRYVSAALKAQGVAVDEGSAGALPASLHELLDYDLVILDNVSGFDLSLAKMELLESYVRDAGGGLIMIGGDRSYAAGGYHGTPVERLLPVDMHVRTELRVPSLSVVFVLDRSGSMGVRIRGSEALAIAKSAALSSIDLLNRFDRVGVLAFDESPVWVVPPTEAGMRQHIAEKLRALETGGGTDLHRALEEAHRVIRHEQTMVKHLIVLSDGLTEGEKQFDALSARIAKDGITVSTVAMGADADRELMARLAALGKGRFYHADDPHNVPRIFAAETLTAARDLVVEGDIRPRPVQTEEWIEGLGAGGFPALGGYQRAFAKPAARVLLAGRDEDPLLASWRYGLGRAAAFTSDLSGRWGRRWVQWPEFGRFVSQMARWTMRRSGAETFLPRFGWSGQRGEVSVDVLDRDDRFVNSLELEALIVDPSRASRHVPLAQIAPGRYHADFPAARSGRYYVTLSGRDGGRPVGPATFGVALPYSPEHLDLGVDHGLLRDIAASTGGRLLALSAAGMNAVTAPPAHAPGPLWRVWWPFFLAALVLLVLEVAARKVALPDAWRARWLKWHGARGDAEASETGYEELRARLERERTGRLASLRADARPTAGDPAVRARLYLAAGRARAR
jgi:Mg-chelatase subunit ChlD